MLQSLSMVLLGFSLGIAFQRLVIMGALNRFPQSICDYCEWNRKRSRKRTED